MFLGSAPLITYYSATSNNQQDGVNANSAQGIDQTVDRVELSQVTFNNWVAKTSNLLADEFGFDPALAGEASAVIDLPLHWLHSVWITSLWNMGGYVTTRQRQASIIVTDAPKVDAALLEANRNQAVVGCALGSGLDALSSSPADLSNSPSAQRAISPAALDYSHDVRMFADSFESGYTSDDQDIAFESETDEITHLQLAAMADEFCEQHEISHGSRVLLSDLTGGSAVLPVLLLGALIRREGGTTPQASLVLCNGLSPDQIQHIAEQERAIVLS